MLRKKGKEARDGDKIVDTKDGKEFVSIDLVLNKWNVVIF